MPKEYIKTFWVDEQTPLDAEHMNKIEEGISEASEGARHAAVRLEIEQDDMTGVVTICLYDSEDHLICERTLDLETEKIIEEVALDYTNALLVFTLHDGSYITCDISDLKNVIVNLQNEIGKPTDDYTKNTIYGRIAKEEKERKDAIGTTSDTSSEDTVYGHLKAEEERASQAESDLDDKIDNEINRATQAESDLNQAILDETARATQAESDLNQAILDETDRATNAESDLNQAILDETDRATQAEEALDDKIDDEITRAEQVEGDLNQAIFDETDRATNAEQDILDNIGNKTDSPSENGTVYAYINQEKKERTDAIGTPGDEVSVNSVYGRLNKEIARAKGEETIIKNSIGTSSDASTEPTVHGRIQKEIEDRQSADTQIINTAFGSVTYVHTNSTGKIHFVWKNLANVTILENDLQLNTNEIITGITLNYNQKKLVIARYNNVSLECDLSAFIDDVLTKISAEETARVNQIGATTDSISSPTVYGYINKQDKEINDKIGTNQDEASLSTTVYAYIKKKTDDINTAIGTSSDPISSNTVYGYINNAINNRELEAGHKLAVSQNNNNELVLSLLNKSNTVIDTHTVDLKINGIIKAAELEYSNKRIKFTKLDNSVMYCDLTTLIDTLQNQITTNTNDLANYKTGIEVIGGNLQVKHNATIEGDLLVKGTTTTSDQETIQSKATLIVTNSENVELVNFTGTVALKGTYEKYTIGTYAPKDEYAPNKYYYLEIDPNNPSTYEYKLDDNPTQTIGRQYYVPRGEAASIYDKTEDSLLIGEGLYIGGDFYFTDYYAEVKLTQETYEPDTYYILTQYRYYELATGTFDPNEVYYEKIIQTHGENIATRDLPTNLINDHLVKWDANKFMLVDSGKTYTDIETLVSTEIAKQVHGLSAGTTENHILVFGEDGYHIKDSGKTLDDTGKVDTISITGADIPADAHKNIDLPTVRTDTNAQNLSSTQKTNAKTNLDLNNVDNTSDVDKPISTLVQNALDLKVDKASIGYIEISGNSGTLTNDQYNEALKPYCIIKRGYEFWYKDLEDSFSISFKLTVLGLNNVTVVKQLLKDESLWITKSTKGWTYGYFTKTFYTDEGTDALLATKLALTKVATIETSTTASKAYAVGDLLIYNEVIYRVINAIASGETITVDTNVVAKTIEELLALKVNYTDLEEITTAEINALFS